MFKLFLVVGSISAALAVALGAFGAHGLENKLTERFMKIYQTAVQYHIIHSVALVLVGILATRVTASPLLNGAGWSLIIGMVLFSGSLYVLSVTGITKLGMITPLGGLAFIVGWILLAAAALKM